jgi:Flp pilus assembly protein CpaB
VSHPPTIVAVRARRALARPLTRRAGVAALAAVTGLTVASLVSSTDRARQRWGASRPVAVATRDLHAGEVVDAAAVEVRDLPRVAVAARALDHLPAGAVVRDPVAAGEPLVPSRLAPLGLTGTAALVPDGHRAVAVPLGPAGAPPLAIGDRVDVLAVVGTAPGDGHAGADGGPTRGATEPAFPVAEAAQVVDVTEGSVTLAVPTDDAARVALVATQGLGVLALAGA